MGGAADDYGRGGLDDGAESEQTRFPISRLNESHMRDSLSPACLLSHLLIIVHHHLGVLKSAREER